MMYLAIRLPSIQECYKVKFYYGEEAGNNLWYENADKIANFLSSANPNYSEKVLKDMLHKHLQYVTGQAITRLNKDWNSDI